MARTTHDRVLDHHTSDLDTNMVTDGALAAPISTTAGQTVHQALADITAYVGHILIGTADPTAGGGVAHPQPALYLRDNAGVTELWTPTGAGTTAWQKITIP